MNSVKASNDLVRSVSYDFTDLGTLVPGAWWISRVISTMGITGISFRVNQDCNVIFEQSSDIERWDIVDMFYFHANENFNYLVQALSSYARLVLTNNNESIMNFELQTTLLYPISNTKYVPPTAIVLHKQNTRFDILKRGIH